MEILMLNPTIKEQLTAYRDNNSFIRYEKAVIKEILIAVENRDTELLTWFNQFGNDFRHIIMNVHAYREGLKFGFTKIVFNKYGWFERPQFLDVEELVFGKSTKFGEYSTITIGRGVNSIWTYGYSYHYGTAGCSSPICVYDKQFKSREVVIAHSVKELKDDMQAKIDNKDATNYKQDVIVATLKDIIKYEVDRVQLTLF